LTYTLIEPCCGSAALTLHMLGATKPLMPYQGTKWRYRFALAELIEELGFEGPPSKVDLMDVGFWGTAMGSLLDPEARAVVIDALREKAERDPKEVFDELQGSPVFQSGVNSIANFLFLQRLAFSGKAVGMRARRLLGNRWSSPGFNKSSAYGLEKTDKFGTVSPMIPSLIRVLEELDLLDVEFETRCLAVDPARAKDIDGPTVVYIDPPYKGTTAYPDGILTRYEVMELAMAWWERGAAVIVSEQEPISELRWNTKRLYKGRKDDSPFKGKQEEWVTYMAHKETNEFR
jgi:hypothetical protein